MLHRPTDSPRAVIPPSVSSQASPSTPVHHALHSTPCTRLIHPADSPIRAYSHSVSVPFDWVDARSRRPPPYGTSSGGKCCGPRKSKLGMPAKKMVHEKGLVERLTAVPSKITFDCSQFPNNNNLPLPSPKTTAWLIGGALHFLRLCVRVSQIRKVTNLDLGWEDMYREGEGELWFD